MMTINVFLFGVFTGFMISCLCCLIFWQEARKWKGIVRKMLPVDPLARARLIRDLSRYE